MGGSVMIVTSDSVSSADLASFVTSVGGQRVPHEQARFVIGDGDTDVWLAVEAAEYFNVLYTPEVMLEWERALGRPPVTGIEMRLDHGSKRKQFYLYVAYRFSHRWNSVLDDIDDSVVSAATLQRRYLVECADLTIGK